MRGTPHKQQNRPFRNVRSFSGSHFHGLWISWISAAEGCRNEVDPTKAAKSFISQCSLLFRKPFPGPLGFSGFPAAERQNRPFRNVRSFSGSHVWISGAETRGTLQKQQNRPFRNVRSFSRSHVQGPVGFLDFRPPKEPNEGNPTKAAKSSISQCSILFAEAISMAPWILWISGR